MQPVFSAIDTLAHTRAADCYQCGKCSAGCPVAGRMDQLPNQLVRLVQLGLEERAMKAEAIWLCVACQTCSARCPKSVDCAGVMDALRELAAGKNLAAPAQRRTVIFQKAFLQNIRRNGRLNELELAGAFKTRAFLGDLNLPLLMKDALLTPQLMRRGKLHLRGGKARDRRVIERIFRRCLGG
ncbi:MAG: 4Fe-4S dicluster domain-containing protein [bacterium]|nr:4Fe-4S dicluster domain-containing protein [bacterium]